MPLSAVGRKQTLLTGFGSFGNVRSNPSQRLVEYFTHREIAGQDLTVSLLPVSYRRAPEQIQAVIQQGGRESRPFDNVLMLGVAGSSANWRVERFGRNYCDTALDREGYAPASPVIYLDVPERLPATFPVQAVVSALEQCGLPVLASESAGGYLCNYILFTTLRYLQRIGSCARAGFLHIPADDLTFHPEQPGGPQFSFEQHIEAVHAALNALNADAIPPM